MKQFSDFYDLLMPELPGMTTTMLDLHLLLQAREFCEVTSCWRADFDAITTVADQATYDVDTSEPQSELVRLLKVTLNDVLLWDQGWYERARTDDDAPKYTRDDPPFSISDDRSQITLIADETPTSAVTGGLELSGSMKPTSGATGLPDFLLTVHAEAMRVGTLARLMRMAKKPWADPALAAAYAGEYASAVNNAASTAQRGNTKAPLRTRKWG